MTLRAIAIIPCRYDSKRLPGKPLRKILDKTLVQHIYENIKNGDLFEQVIVATDDPRIVNEVKSFNGIVKLSSKKHPSGTDRIAEIASEIDADVFVNVQGDELFMTTEVLKPLLACFDENKISVATLAHELKDNEEINNPNRIKVVCDSNGNALYFSRSVIPYPRAKYSLTYLGHIGVYAFRKDTLMKFAELPQSWLEKIEKLEQLRLLENDIKIKVIMTNYKGFGIDTEEDLEKAEKLLKNI